MQQQKHSQLIQSNTQQQQISQLSEQLLTQLRQIQLSNKAYRFYIKNLLKKAFQGIDESNYEMDVNLMDKVFLILKENLFSKKVKQWHSVKFIRNLQFKIKFNKKLSLFANRQKQERQESLKRQIFSQWKQIYEQNTKYKQLKTIILHYRNQEIMKCLKIFYKHSQIQKSTQQKNNQIIDRIHHRKLLKNKFQEWIFNVKLIKLKKLRLRTKFIEFKVYILEKIQENESLVLKFQQTKTKKIKNLCFQVLKQNKNYRKSIKFHNYTLLHSCLNLWMKSTHIQKQYKQIENSNEIILKHYLDDKQPLRQVVLKAHCFQSWKSICKEMKQTRKRNNQINIKLNQAYQSKLLKRYFDYLKENAKYSKANKHYKLQTKSKVILILQTNLIKQSKKLQKVYEFIEYRKLRRYFYAIQHFNKIQSIQSTLHFQRNCWSKFLMQIAQQYYVKINEADQYRNTLLKFKSILALRQNTQLNKNACFCAFSVNIQWPLERWHKRFKIRNFRSEKRKITLKKAFFDWKVYTITKQGRKSEMQTFENQSLYQRMNTQISNIDSKSKSSRVQNTSFFQKLQQASSDQDNIDKKIDKLMSKIKSKRSKEKLKQNLQENFSSGKLQKIRVPTWGSPDEAYHVSVFQE